MFRFISVVALIKIIIFLFVNDDKLNVIVVEMNKMLIMNGISVKFDVIVIFVGKRYARIDEFGVSFVVIVDYRFVIENIVIVCECDLCG